MRITAFGLLRSYCGLSVGEAADYLGIRPDTVKSLSSGRRVVPEGVMTSLRKLAGLIDRASAERLKQIAASGATEVEIGFCADDTEARTLGFPCASAHAAMIGQVIAKAPDNVAIYVAPRGSTRATAGAADAHGL